MNRLIFFRIILFISFILLHNVLFSQYLRDSTRYTGLNDFHTVDDHEILKNYSPEEKHQLIFSNVFSIPEVMVNFNGNEYPLHFDFGNSGNINITTAIADSIKYYNTDTINTYTPNGKIRGQVYRIVIPEFKTLKQSYSNETGILSDWSIYSTKPFNGLIGLKYIYNKCFTLSYTTKTLAVSNKSILSKLTKDKYELIQLEHFKMHPYGIHFKGKINNQDAIIYLDTGKSHSAINRSMVPRDKIISDKSGSFFKGSVNIEIGGKSFIIHYPRVKNTNRNINSNLPVGIEIGSDILKHILLTVDRTDNKNLLIIHR
jgi:hypothetical protein